MMNIFDMTVDNTAKKNFSEEELYKEIFSADEITRAKMENHLRPIAKELDAKADFDTMMKAYSRAKKSKVIDFPTVGDTARGTVFLTKFSDSKYADYSTSWMADDEGIKEVADDGRCSIVSFTPMLIAREIRTQQTGEVRIVLAYKSDIWREVTLPRETICSPSKIITLANFGIHVTSKTAGRLIDYLIDLEHRNRELIPTETATASLGWEGNTFVPYCDNFVFGGMDEGLRTIYDAVRTNGSSSEWYSYVGMLRATERKEIMVSLASSFASVLVERLNVLPFIVDMWGASGCGKSVSLKLAASVWADPSCNRYIGDFDSTAVATEVKADFLNSLPLMLDDTSKLPSYLRNKFETTIYNLCSGKGKSRANKKLGMQKEFSWKNCTLTTGERPITSFCSQGGAYARTLELECDSDIFQDGAEAVRMFENNFGFAGKEFVSILQKMSNQELQAIYDGCTRRIKDALPKIMGKHLQALATLLTADILIEKYIFKDGRHIAMDVILEMAKTENEVCENETCYQEILDKIAMNQSRFDVSSNCEKWGIVKDGKAIFYRKAFDNLCEDLGHSASAFLGWAAKEGIIDTDKGRYDKNRRLSREESEALGKKQDRCVYLNLERPEKNTEQEEDLELPY